jgi:putative ABC transport system permease protein
MLALNRKLIRDIWHIRAQVLALALVIASGVAVLVMSLSTIEALTNTAEAYYERYRFAHVFARVERAPEHLRGSVTLLPGVQTVATRIIEMASLDIAGFSEPVIGQLVSLPDNEDGALNRLALQTGRFPSANAVDEVVLSEPFADAHGLGPQDRLRAIINGRWRELTIVGIALSPEYVYTIGPGSLIPDNQRFGILWMRRDALQAAFDLDGAFNDISVRLMHGASPQAVIAALDDMFERYGGHGAYARADQQSNWFLMNEISQLRTMSLILPVTFLAVAAFLTNVLLSRMIAVERGEIGLLKAFGYGNFALGWHYTKFAMAIAAAGIALGWLAGYAFGRTSTETYASFFRFPFLLYAPGPRVFLIGAIASVAAALLGTLGAVSKVVQLPPAEAMRPPAPPVFRRSGLRILAWLDQPTRILLRQLTRWPGRSLVTSLGISMAVAVLVSSIHWLDAVDELADVYFEQAQRQDLTVSFVKAQDSAVERNLARLPGVLTTEPMRSVPARMRFGPREERQTLMGVPATQELMRVHDVSTGPVHLPPDGLVLSTQLAGMLNAQVGDVVDVEILEGQRPTLHLPVTGLFETYIGTPAYMEIGALNRALREGGALTSVHLRVDAADENALYAALREIPLISAVTLKSAALSGFHDTLADTILIFIGFFVVFACALAVGVTYNAARIALAERGWELATMEVLGYSHAEISYLLLGEIVLLTLLAFPLGAAIGYLLAVIWHGAFVTELFRVPLAILPRTYGLSILVTVGATFLAALLVRRRLDHLDLVAVLKTRE